MHWLLSFLIIYGACALMFQLGGATPSWGPSSALEAFSAGLFAMIALVTLGLARKATGWRAAYWFASSLAIAALGLDELFELHEAVELPILSEADHLKVALWLGAAGSLAVVHWMERPPRRAQAAMALGYALHTVYLILETGDGGYFRLPMSAGLRDIGEELAILGMLSAYLISFWSISAVAAEPAPMEPVAPTNEAKRAA